MNIRMNNLLKKINGLLLTTMIMVTAIFSMKSLEVSAADTYTATIYSNTLYYGTVSASKTTGIEEGGQITLTITPNDGRDFIDETYPLQVFVYPATAGSDPVIGALIKSESTYSCTISNITCNSSVVVCGTAKHTVKKLNFGVAYDGENYKLVGITPTKSNYYYMLTGNCSDETLSHFLGAQDLPILEDSLWKPVPLDGIIDFGDYTCIEVREVANSDNFAKALWWAEKPTEVTDGGFPDPVPGPTTEVTASTLEKTLYSTNFANGVLKSWEDINKALTTLSEKQVLSEESSADATPLLKVNIQGTDKAIGATTLNSFKGENKGLHVHLGNGFAVTMFGQNMTGENKNLNLEFTMTDTQTNAGKERTIDFTNKAELGMQVVLHAYLPEATKGQEASIYTEDANGTRTLVTKVIISDLNRICFNIERLEKYVIVY